jgi:transcriptional regulator with XRE-family HTH domain
MTQQELADQAGVSNSHISKIESGKETPSNALLERLAAVLRADLDELTLASGRLPDDVLRHLVADPDLARKVISYVRLAVTR